MPTIRPLERMRSKKASRLAGQYLRTGRLVASRSEVGAIGTAAQRGIPGLLIEFGDGGRWDEREDVALFRYGILNTLRHLDILPGEAICHPTPDSETSYSLYAEQEGLWMPTVQAGQQGICKGDLLGVITDPFGEEIGRYIAPADGMVLYQTSSLSVRVGDHLVAMA